MKQIVKRIITFALSAAMVLTLVPTTAFAEDTGSNKVNKNLRVSGTSNVDVNLEAEKLMLFRFLFMISQVIQFVIMED